MAEALTTIMTYENVDQAQYHLEQLRNAGLSARLEEDIIREPPTPHSLPEHGGPVRLVVPEREPAEAGEVFQENLDAAMEDNPSVS